jgi:hypothetical protein
MALDDETREGRDGKVLPLDMREGTLLAHHGLGGNLVRFVEYTTEVALPRKGGAVVRFEFIGDSTFLDGVTDTAVAGELTAAPRLVGP